MNNGDKSTHPTFVSEAITFAELGLTKREHFAAMAMQGICVNAGRNEFAFHKPEELAIAAVSIADALLKALEQQE